jgi:mannosyltransferase
MHEVTNALLGTAGQDTGLRQGHQHWRSLARHIFPDRAIAALVGIIALGFNLHKLGTVSLWYDEAWSYGLASQPLHVMRLYIWGLFQNMALYYLFLHVWLRALALAGMHPIELLVRLPSAIFAALGAVVLFLLGQRFWGRVAGAVAAALYIVNALQLYSAQQARAYAMEMLLVCTGWYALLAALNAASPQSRRRWWIGYVIIMTLAVYAHLFSGLVIVAQAAALGGLLILPGPWRAKTRASLRQIITSFIAIAILIVPIGLDAALNGGESLWIPPAHLSDLYYRFLLAVTGGSVAYLGLLSAASVLAILAAAIMWAKTYFASHAAAQPIAKNIRLAVLHQPMPGTFALACWLVVPVILSFATTQPHFNLHLFYPRYLAIVVPAFCLLAGIGISLIRWRAAQLILALALATIALQQAPGYYAHAQVQDFRPPMRWLQEHYQAEDGIACYPDLECFVGVNYYLQAYPGPAHFDPNSPGRWYWQYYYPVPATIKALQGYITRHPRIFFIDAPIGGIPRPATIVAQRWLDSHCQFVAQSATATVTIRLYATASCGYRLPETLRY